MASDRSRSALARGRALLDRLGALSPAADKVIARVGTELVQSHERNEAKRVYEGHYFGDGRDPSGDRQGHSGYARYDRVSSNADIAGFVLWRTFGGAQSAIDVGCATGFVVEVLRELGLDAVGCDVSRFAIDAAAPGAKGHIRLADVLTGLPWA